MIRYGSIESLYVWPWGFSNWTESLTVITSAHCSTNNPSHLISLSNVISETGQSFLRCSRWFDSKHGHYTEWTGVVSRRPSSDIASGVWDVLPLLPGDMIQSSRESHGCNQGSADERQRKGVNRGNGGEQVLDKCAPKLTPERLCDVFLLSELDLLAEGCHLISLFCFKAICLLRLCCWM